MIKTVEEIEDMLIEEENKKGNNIDYFKIALNAELIHKILNLSE